VSPTTTKAKREVSFPAQPAKEIRMRMNRNGMRKRNEGLFELLQGGLNMRTEKANTS
jgi:hypothetical protein